MRLEGGGLPNVFLSLHKYEIVDYKQILELSNRANILGFRSSNCMHNPKDGPSSNFHTKSCQSFPFRSFIIKHALYASDPFLMLYKFYRPYDMFSSSHHADKFIRTLSASIFLLCTYYVIYIT